ncbi:hypothetical protein M3Y95_00745000 [Aphelenchoides besseyi]|nr:hypothetical protein M3Y95_00745000 [Aphelenchoides besseyi]
MRTGSVLLILVVFGIWLSDACKITLKVRSSTKTPFKLQVYIPAMQLKTERVLFSGPSEKKVQVNGDSNKCMEKKWVFRTWKQDKDGNWVVAKETHGKLVGVGFIRILIDDSLNPIANDRMGIACSEGAVCG